MVRPLNISVAVALAFVGLIAALLMLGPGAAESEAAQCKGSAKPAYELSNQRAAKATLCLLNKQRAAQGLGALHADAKQTEAASQHNRTMIRTSCFAHLCPGEKDLIGRIVATGYLPCICIWLVGENIAWGTGKASSPRQVVASWMNSAPHRLNILNPKFDEIGVAVDPGSPVGNVANAATYTTDFGFKS